jgi:hypothetical protein
MTKQRRHLTRRFHRRFGFAKRGEDGALGGRLRGAAIDEIAAMNEMMKANNE